MFELAFFLASLAFLLCSASFFPAAILPGCFGTVCFVVVVVICSESGSSLIFQVL